MVNIKKTYTLTFHDVPNIDAILQAYSLQKFIINSGYESEIINYLPTYHYLGLLKPYKGLKRNINKFKMLRHIRQFKKNHLNVTKYKLRSLGGLEKFDADEALIVGSDQIWNPDLTGHGIDRVFMLDNKTHARKISYAASAGGKIISDKNVKSALQDFSAISVREEYLEHDLTTSNVFTGSRTVLDPTFLISDYANLIDREPRIHNDYVASYEVSSSSTRSIFLLETDKMKAKCGLPIYHLGSNPMTSADLSLVPPSPTQWLRTINDAKYVITNSFHGLAFSIILKKKFIYLLHLEEEKNARAMNLLKIAKLEKRAVRSVDEIDMGQIDAEINYTYIEQECLRSRRFLLDSLA